MILKPPLDHFGIGHGVAWPPFFVEITGCIAKAPRETAGLPAMRT
jgi:hypothetical protein